MSSKSAKADKELPVKKDKSEKIPQRDKLSIVLTLRPPVWTEKQQNLINTILDKDSKLIFVSGPAGTAKTLIATYCGLMLLQDKKVTEILYVRSAVESSDNPLGFLPGKLEDKYNPFVEPFFEKLYELLPTGGGHQQILHLKKEERLVAKPVGFLRGTDTKLKYVLSDESQNLTLKELTTLLTRFGKHSKMVVCGDFQQSDISPTKASAFKQVCDAFNDEEAGKMGIKYFEFDVGDIMRSEECKFIVERLCKLKLK